MRPAKTLRVCVEVERRQQHDHQREAGGHDQQQMADRKIAQRDEWKQRALHGRAVPTTLASLSSRSCTVRSAACIAPTLMRTPMRLLACVNSIMPPLVAKPS